MVRCPSHKFKLAVEEIHQNHKDVISVVYSLILKFRSPMNTTKILRKTYLTVKIKNETGGMMQRYSKLREQFHALIFD